MHIVVSNILYRSLKKITTVTQQLRYSSFKQQITNNSQ